MFHCHRFLPSLSKKRVEQLQAASNFPPSWVLTSFSSPFDAVMASSKRWASIISSIASFLHFFVIIFQVPVFRVPCRTGTCTSPIEVMSSHLIATELYPAFGPKALLYPGAIARSYIKNRTFPSYSKLSKLYNLTNLRKTSASTDLQHLEILAGSYLAVAGAVLGLIRLGRTSLFGTLLILWGFVREVILKNSASMNSARSIHIYPVTMCIALLCAFLTIRKDVRKLIRCCRTQRGAKSLRFKAKIM